MHVRVKKLLQPLAVLVAAGVFLLFFLFGYSDTVDVKEWGVINSLWSDVPSRQLPESPVPGTSDYQQSNQASLWLRSVAVNRRRLQHLHNTCSLHGNDHYLLNGNARENMRYFLSDTNHRLLYCFIPKVATSTMKRVLSILGGTNHGTSLFNISSIRIHGAHNAYAEIHRETHMSFLRTHHMFSTATKVIVVRDPYEKLFSAFIDRMLAVTRNLNLIDRVHMVKDHENDPCARAHVKFSDVVEYVTRTPPQRLEEHYRPYFVTCFPCHVAYDYIGKMETFHSDLKTILTSLGVDVEEVIGNDKQFDVTSELSIVRDVSARPFSMMSSKNLHCFTKLRIFRRVWIALQERFGCVQVRGYLSVDDHFPITPAEVEKVTAEQFAEMTRAAYLSVKDREAVRQQRGQAMREAFHNLPRPLLHKLHDVLQRDCDLFGYDCSVDRRFPESERPEPVFNLDQA